jgi:hypothetical protein
MTIQKSGTITIPAKNATYALKSVTAESTASSTYQHNPNSPTYIMPSSQKAMDESRSQ